MNALIIWRNPPCDGAFDWNPDLTTPGGDYRLRVTSTTAPATTDTSNGDFCISTPGFDGVVELNATVETVPFPRITLRWMPWPDANNTGFTVKRKLPEETVWLTLATLPASASSHVDSTAIPGTVYDYWVYRNPGASGYIQSAIAARLVEDRGKIILIVDSLYTDSLAAELQRLTLDLIGDGWQVIRHDVARTVKPPAVKALIQADYDADPTRVKSVYLFGRVAIAISGLVSPDGHSARQVEADGYYGDMTTPSGWTDTRTDSGLVANDGKFDQDYLPSSLELNVGRVDLFNMPAFNLNALELHRQYLNKAHKYRFKTLTAQNRALVDDEFNAYSSSGWQSWSATAGIDNVRVGDWLTTLQTNDYLFGYGCGGGSSTSASGVATTAEMASKDPKVIFTMLFGSYFVQWSATDNLLRSPLATSCGLTCAWAGFDTWYFHPLALGATTGECALQSMNSAGEVYLALMGDPSLRLHVVAPPSNLTLSGNTLNWTASPDATVLGYHVYRATSSLGIYTRLTTNPVVGTSYTDAGGGSNFHYMLRAVKLEVSTTGSYYNASNGIYRFASGTPGWVTMGQADGLTVLPGVTQQFTSIAYDPAFNALSPQPAITWSVSGGGTINAAGLFTPSVGSSGRYTVVATAAGASASRYFYVTPANSIGGITRERFDGISGTTVALFTASVDFPGNPSLQTVETSLFEAPSTQGGNYGQRMHGYFTAPQTGNYFFYIAGNAAAELWMSTDTNPGLAVKIAFTTTATTSRSWTTNASQKSAAIALVAGQKYYLLALHKNGTGTTDNLAVGMDLPDTTQERPILATRLETIPSVPLVAPLSDGFNDGARSNGVYLKDTDWWKNNAGTTLSVINNDATLPGNVLSWSDNTSSTTPRAVVGRFPTVTLTNVGDRITFECDMRLTGTIGNGFRNKIFWGVFNTNGTNPTADQATADQATADTDDIGYYASLLYGQGSSGGAASPWNGLYRETGTNITSLAGTDTTLLASANTYRVTDSGVRHLVLTIQKTDDGQLTLTSLVKTGAGINHQLTFVDDTPATYTFDEALLGIIGDNNPRVFDNFTVLTNLPDVPVVVTPVAPSGLTATPVGSTQINLTWTDNASDETGFKLERKTTGTFAQIATPAANTMSISNTSLTPGTTYVYRLRATNGGGDSAYSNEITATAYTPLQSWRIANGLPVDGTGIGADTYDVSGNGVPNLLKYALGMDANATAQTGLPLIGTSVGNRLTLSFQRDPSLTDISYTVEATSELVGTWTPIARSVAGATTSNLDNGAFSITETGTLLKAVTVEDNTLLSTNPKRFLRLKISQP